MLTGIECPGCGTGRAVVAYVHGDLFTALDHNVILPFIAPLLLVSLVGLLLGKRPLLERRGWARSLLLLLVGFWVLRLLPFDALSYLDSAAS